MPNVRREQDVVALGPEIGTQRRISRVDYVSRAFRGGPYTRCDEMYEFTGAPDVTTLSGLFVNTAANVDLAQLGTTSGVSRVYFKVPRAGTITGVSFVGEDGVTQSGTNFQTFTGLNLQTAGTGNVSFLSITAHVNTTDANAAALNGGVDLTAKKPYDLTLSAVAGALQVKEGDILELTATVSAAGAVVDAATAFLTIEGIPLGLKPTVTHTAGATTTVPTARVSANVANGKALMQFSATSEIQAIRLDWGDQLLIPASRRPRFEAMVTLPTVTTAQALTIGFASAFNATLDSVTSNIWFRYIATLLPVIETDDGTTDTDDQVTGVTSVTATTYLYTIDMADLSSIKFYINETLVGTTSATAFSASLLLQPVIWMQKTASTGTIATSVDFVRVSWDRFA